MSDTAPRPASSWTGAALGLALAAPFVPLLLLHRDGALDVGMLLLVLGAGARFGARSREGIPAPAAGAAAGAAVVLAFLSTTWDPRWLVAGYALLAVWHAAGERRVSFGVAWSVAVGALLLALG